LLWWMAQTAGYRTPRFLTFKQALELGGNVRRGEHGTKVYFVKQLHVHDKDGSDDNSATRLVPMMREYTVFNVDQCENLPDSIYTGKPMRVPMRSCCNNADCYPTEIQYVHGKIYARRREDGKYILIPSQKVERNRDNPDGRNHLCAPPPALSPMDTVYCFALGGAT
jgi:hypothetical protein